MSTRLLTGTATATATLLLLVACESQTQVAGDPAVSETPTLATADPVVEGASPISERDRKRQREFREAIRGLHFEDGVLRVDALGRADAQQARAYVEEGRSYMATNQRTPSIRAMALAVRSDPGDPDLYMLLGDAFITKGKTEMAAASYRTASEMDPALVEPRVRLASTLARDQHLADAIETMNGVLELDPAHAFAHERLAIWNYYTGEYATAWTHVHASRRLGSDVPPQFEALLQKQMPDPAASAGTR
jgi:tetratricopeptide (TPR) repeat protein